MSKKLFSVKKIRKYVKCRLLDILPRALRLKYYMTGIKFYLKSNNKVIDTSKCTNSQCAFWAETSLVDKVCERMYVKYIIIKGMI